MRLRNQSWFVLLALVAAVAFAGMAVAGPPTAVETPTPSIGPRVDMTSSPVSDVMVPPAKDINPFIQGAPPLGVNWSALSFDDNAPLTGYYFIPVSYTHLTLPTKRIV